MATLTELDASYSNISNLTGLEHAINLTELSLDNNTISDLSPFVSNTGLGNGDKVNVRGNPLNTVSINTHIPTLQSREVEVLFDAPAPSPPVDIPDANLRAKIEIALGKASDDVITTADMATLTRLDAPNANISNLTGLEHAINLTELSLDNNRISGPLAVSFQYGIGRGQQG